MEYIICGCIVIFAIVFCIVVKVKTAKINRKIQHENLIIFNENEELKKSKEYLLTQCEGIKQDLFFAQKHLDEERKTYDDLKVEEDKTKIRVEGLTQQERATKERIDALAKSVEGVAKSQQELVAKAFENYCESLDKEYYAAECEYKELKKLLEKAYDDRKAELYAAATQTEQDLEKIRQTRAAAIEALRREKEILADSSFYCIEISDEDKADIARLESIKKTLNKPRVLSMLIWSTWYQKPLKQLSANILGPNIITGIYKITNIITGEVYIGQSTDIAKRWSEHAKCGLDIDCPAGNKLYKAMMEYGLHSFSWELMEECPVSDLNAKEKFYIDLYESVNYGYNITHGNK